jgi:hypothetical protein
MIALLAVLLGVASENSIPDSRAAANQNMIAE